MSVSYEYIGQLLQHNEIVNWKEVENSTDNSGNVIIIFVDRNNTQHYSLVRHDRTVNKIYPPIIPPTVICLKGQIHQYGQSLERSPDNLIYIGRNLNMGGWKLPKSKWYNPFTVKQYGLDDALIRYRNYVLNTPELLNSLPELSGKILACWCHPSRCHGDVLIELFNRYVT